MENPKENFRIRIVIIVYFLEDGTMQITEQKVRGGRTPDLRWSPRVADSRVVFGVLVSLGPHFFVSFGR